MANKSELNKQIQNAQAHLGLVTPQEIALEASRFIDRRYLMAGVIVGHPHVERIFGDEAWLGHLNARRYLTTQGRDQPMTVEHMNRVHRLYLEPTQTEGAGQLRSRNFRGGEIDEYTPIRLTHTQRIALQTHPTAGFEQDGENLNVGYIIYPDYKVIPTKFKQIVADYERGQGRRHDPFLLHSGMQRRLIGVHVWDVDMNGRATRALMNDGLERDGKPPSSPLSFSDDLYVSSRGWRKSVKEGSTWFKRAHERVADGVQDLATIFDLREYTAYFGAMRDRLRVPTIRTDGGLNNMEEFTAFLDQIERGVQAPFIEGDGSEPMYRPLSNLKEVGALLKQIGCEYVMLSGDAYNSVAGVRWTITKSPKPLGIEQIPDLFVAPKTIVFTSDEKGGLHYHLEVNGTKIRTNSDNNVASDIIHKQPSRKFNTYREATHYFLWDFAEEEHHRVGPEGVYGFQFYNGPEDVDKNIDVSIAGVLFTFEPTSHANGVLEGKLDIQAPI